MRVYLDLDEAEADYFTKCARIRGIAPRSLIRRLLDTIAQDQMTASVLDDENEIPARRKGEHRYRGTAPAV